jgi:hypothetical protein
MVSADWRRALRRRRRAYATAQLLLASSRNSQGRTKSPCAYPIVTRARSDTAISAVNASIMFNRPLLGLMHLGISRPVGILGGRRRIDDHGIVLVATFSLFAVSERLKLP